MILIPAGEFLMGSDSRQDKDAFDDEQPQHLLYLPDYYMAKTPVTNAQYLAFVQAIGYQPPKHWPKGKPPSYKADHPVVNVSWYDAVAYCDWLVQVTGKPYCLPSEAEWEKGARGTDGRIYPWSNQWEARRCNSRELLPGDTTPVDAYLDGASPYGLLDIVGYVEEWTRSLWGKDLERPDFKYPYQLGSDREDARAGDEICRVLRGASVFYDERGYIIARRARCAFRRRFSPNHERDDWGFRVAMSLFFSSD
jgi:formylglycine-generating enzyme required for sulfatase activity